MSSEPNFVPPWKTGNPQTNMLQLGYSCVGYQPTSAFRAQNLCTLVSNTFNR